MVSGNSVSLILPFALAPFITRIYSPEDFAGYELFAAIVAMIATLGSLRYEYGIILPKTEEEADGVVKLSFRILISATVLSALLLIPLRENIGDLSGSTSLESLIWWVPPAVFFTGGVVILNQYLMRLEQFKVMATNKILATASNHGSKYLFGLALPSSLGLVLGHLVGMVIPFLSLFTRTQIRQLVKRLVSKRYELKAIAKKYREFPLYNTPHAFYDEGHKTLLFFLISLAYGEALLGLFALTIRYLRIPVQVFGSSLSQVFMPRVVKDRTAGKDIRPLVRRLMIGSALVGIIPFGLIILFGEPVFGFVFGAEWAESGRYASILAPWLFLNFITSPVSMIPTIVSRQGAFFAMNVLFTIVAILLVFAIWKLGYSFTTAAYAYMAVNALLNLLLIFWFLHIASKGFSEVRM
jgi:O-antigen/teichoic acid export membrane protein